jgi:hypothetical protein
MNPISHLLKNFLQSGNKPRSQRETSALLDESRSILVSQLPTTGEHISNFTDADIDGILAGGKGATMARAHSIHRKKYATAAPAPRPAQRPAAKQDRISELAKFITQPRKPLSSPAAKATQTSPNKFAEAKTATTPTAVTITAEGITSHSQRGGRAIKESISNQKTKSKI